MVISLFAGLTMTASAATGLSNGVLTIDDIEPANGPGWNWDGAKLTLSGIDLKQLYMKRAGSGNISVTIVLEGANRIATSNKDYAVSIYGSLTIEGSGTLDIINDGYPVGSSNNESYGISASGANSSITINSGRISISGENLSRGIDSSHLFTVNGGYLTSAGVIAGFDNTKNYVQNGGYVKLSATATDRDSFAYYGTGNSSFSMNGGYFEVTGVNGMKSMYYTNTNGVVKAVATGYEYYNPFLQENAVGGGKAFEVDSIGSFQGGVTIARGDTPSTFGSTNGNNESYWGLDADGFPTAATASGLANTIRTAVTNGTLPASLVVAKAAFGTQQIDNVTLDGVYIKTGADKCGYYSTATEAVEVSGGCYIESGSFDGNGPLACYQAPVTISKTLVAIATEASSSAINADGTAGVTVSGSLIMQSHESGISDPLNINGGSLVAISSDASAISAKSYTQSGDESDVVAISNSDYSSAVSIYGSDNPGSFNISGGQFTAVSESYGLDLNNVNAGIEGGTVTAIGSDGAVGTSSAVALPTDKLAYGSTAKYDYLQTVSFDTDYEDYLLGEDVCTVLFFSKDPPTVSFDARNGDATVTYENYNDVTWKDYYLEGWYTGIDGAGVKLGGSLVPNATYYAHWQNGEGGKTIRTTSLELSSDSGVTYPDAIYDSEKNTYENADQGWKWCLSSSGSYTFSKPVSETNYPERTLFLDGLTIDMASDWGDLKALKYESSDKITIVLADDSVNNITAGESDDSYNSYGAYIKPLVNITGSGTLSLTGGKADYTDDRSYGLMTDSTLEITDGATVNCYSTAGSSGTCGLYSGTVKVYNSTLTAVGADATGRGSRGIYAGYGFRAENSIVTASAGRSEDVGSTYGAHSQGLYLYGSSGYTINIINSTLTASTSAGAEADPDEKAAIMVRSNNSSILASDGWRITGGAVYQLDGTTPGVLAATEGSSTAKVIKQTGADPVVISYTPYLSFEARSGQEIDRVEIKDDMGALPTPGAWGNYSFAGWYTGFDGLGEAVDLDAAKAFATSKTIYAKWTSCGKTVITTPLDFSGSEPTLPENSGITWCQNRIETYDEFAPITTTNYPDLTLFLDGAIIDCSGGSDGNAVLMEDYLGSTPDITATIHLTGNNTIKAASTSDSGAVSTGINFYDSLMFTGLGHLLVEGGTGDNSCGIKCSSLELSGGASVETKGSAATENSSGIISGYAVLTDGTLKATGGSAVESYGIMGDAEVNGGSLTASGSTQAINSMIITSGIVMEGDAAPGSIGDTDYSAGEVSSAKYISVCFTSYLHFDTRSGEAVAPIETGTVTQLPAATWNDYTFDGWYTGIDGTGVKLTLADAQALTSSASYYAKWTRGGKTVITTPMDFSSMENTDKLTTEGWAWYKTETDSYAANTLVLDGATIDCTAATEVFYAVVLPADATIEVRGNTQANGSIIKGGISDGNSTAIYGLNALTFKGTGVLTAVSSPMDVTDEAYSVAIRTRNGDVTFSESVQVTATAGAVTSDDYVASIAIAPNFGDQANVFISGSATVTATAGNAIGGDMAMSHGIAAGNTNISGGSLTASCGTATAEEVHSQALSGTLTATGATVMAGNNSTDATATAYTNQTWVNASFDPDISVGAQSGTLTYGDTTNNTATFAVTARNFTDAFAPAIEWIGTAPTGLTAVMTDNATLSVTYASANAGEYKFKVISGEVESNEVTLTVGKAEYVGSVEKTVIIVINKETAQTGALTAADFFATAPSGAVLTAVAEDEATNGILSAVPELSGGTLSYTSAANLATVEQTDTYQVTIASTNYNDISAALHFITKDKTPITISGVSIGGLTDGAKTYDGVAVAYSGTPIAVTADADTPVSIAATDYEYKWSTAEGTALTEAPKDAGSYKLTVSVKEANENYMGTLELAFTINRAEITVSAGTYKVSKAYDQTTAAGTASGALAVSGILAADGGVSIAAGTIPDYSAADVKADYAIAIPISIIGDTHNNYQIKDAATAVSVIGEITKATLSIEANPTATADYGTAVTHIPLIGGTVKLGTVTINGAWAYDANAAVPDAGTTTAYAATFTPTTGAGNYEVLTADIVPTINQIAYTGTPITGSMLVLQNLEESYVFDLSTLVFPDDFKSKSYTAVAIGTNPDGVLVGTPTIADGKIHFSTGAVVKDKSGVLNVTVTNTNYVDYTVAITVTTTAKMPVTISGVSIGGLTDGAKTYDGVAVTYSGTPTAVTVVGNTAVSIPAADYEYKWRTADGTALTEAPKDAGSYKLTVCVKEANENHIGTLELAFTITQKTVTVTADDKAMSVKGTLPPFTVTYDGFVGADNADNTLLTKAVVACTADGTITGSFPIDITTQAVLNDTNGKNYVITEQNGGTLSVAWVNPFDDVKDSDWFYDDVAFINGLGLMRGTDETEFSPQLGTTRGMVVTILYRLEGEPEVTGTCPFGDVKPASYYEKAITWAAMFGIVNGYSKVVFAPDKNVTREQLAAILYRYAAYKEYDITASADLTAFKDKSQISDYALAAISWANANELIKGKGEGILDPRGNARRCEVAAILHRFCEGFAE